MLYPLVSIPVSRGTPMISPLIKWHHSQDCTVYKYDVFICHKETRDRVIELDTKFGDWACVAGNIIDGIHKKKKFQTFRISYFFQV